MLGIIDYKISKSQELTSQEKKYFELRNFILQNDYEEEKMESFIQLISKNNEELQFFKNRYQENKIKKSIKTHIDIFDESDFDELAEGTITNIPNLYLKVLSQVRNFINLIQGVFR